MNQPLISVIVPVYKVEKYLPRCIESVLKQTYKNFELILVDDGSPDNSGKICDEYALRDNRIKVIHKENGGVSSARNTGIDAANGEYINFIDSDDWVPENSLEILLNTIIENDAELSICGFEFRGIKVVSKKYEKKFIDFRETEDAELVEIFRQCFFYSACGKLFKTKILKEDDIKFSNKIKIGEDTLFVRKYLINIKKIEISNKSVYFYNQLNFSSATKKYYPEHNVWSMDLINTYNDLLNSKLKTDSRKYLFIYALEKFIFTCSFYCKSLRKKEAILKIKETRTLRSSCLQIILFKEETSNFELNSTLATC